MPISKYFKGHGTEVLKNMENEYGNKKGKSVFYATANKTGQKPGEDDDALLPVDADTRTAIARHNAGITKSQDRRAKDDDLDVYRKRAQRIRGLVASKDRRQIQIALAGYYNHPANGPEDEAACKELKQIGATMGLTAFGNEKKTKDDQPIKIGDHVHLGFGAKGGTGFEGVVTNVQGDTVFVKNKEGRTFKGPLKYVTSQVNDEDPDLIQPVSVDPLPTPSGEHNERGWFRGVKDTSALAPKAEQFKNGTRVHNSKGSVGEVVTVNGDKVIVAVAGKRQEWPLAKTFRAAGVEDATRDNITEYQDQDHVKGLGSKALAEANQQLSIAKKNTPNGLRALFEGKIRKEGDGYSWYWNLRGHASDVLPVDDVDIVTKRAAPPAKPKPMTSFAHTPEEIQRIYAPRDPGGFKKQFGKDALTRKQLKRHDKLVGNTGKCLLCNARTSLGMRYCEQCEKKLHGKDAEYTVSQDRGVKDFTPKGHNCDACGAQLSERNYTAPGSWSYKCPQCRFKYNHNGPGVGEQLKAQRKKSYRDSEEDSELKPVPVTRVNPAPRRASAASGRVKDNQADVDEYWKDLKEAVLAAQKNGKSLQEIAGMMTSPVREIQAALAWRGAGHYSEDYTMRNFAHDEVKPVPVTRVNPAPMAKLVPKSKQKPGQDAVGVWKGDDYFIDNWKVAQVWFQGSTWFGMGDGGTRKKFRTESEARRYAEQVAPANRERIRRERGKDDHEDEGFEHHAAKPRKPAPHEDIQPVAV